MARSDRVRHQLFLPRALSERLDARTRGRGATRSQILAQAVAAWLDLGRDRFAAFVERVGQRLVGGRIRFLPENDR